MDTEELDRRNMEAAKRILEKAMRGFMPHGTDQQIAKAIDTVWNDERTNESARYAGNVWAECNALDHIKRALADRSDITARIPSELDVTNHLVNERVAALGEHRRPEIMINAAREAAAMTEEQRARSGAKASEPTAPTDSTASSGRDYHNWDISDPRFDAEIKRRWGYDSWNIPATKRREYAEALQRESYTPLQRKDDFAENELAHLSQTTGRQLSPEERITQFRMAQMRKASA